MVVVGLVAKWGCLLPGIVVLLCLVILQPTTSAWAEDADGISVAIVIDQSESMSGSPREKPSDPEGHRVSLAQQIVYLLALDARNSPRVHDVSVIEFGTQAKVSIDNLRLAHDAGDADRAVRAAHLAVDQLSARDMIYTDTPAAFRAALQTFGPAPAAGPLRRRVLVLVTDGRPERRATSLDTLRSEIKSLSTQLRGRGTELWVIAIDSKSDPYWNTPPAGGGQPDGEFWRDVTAAPDHAILAPNPFPGIARLANEIVDRWLNAGKSETVEGEVYSATPYLRRIVFRVQYAHPTFPLKLVDPGGREITPLAGASGISPEIFNVFEVNRPEPGAYRLSGFDRSRTDVNVQPLGPAISLVDPVGEVALDSPSRLVLQLEYEPGVAVVPLADWPISGSLHVISPSKKTLDLPLRSEASGRLLTDWTPAEPGIYSIDVAAQAHAPDGTSYDLQRGAQPLRIQISVAQHPTYSLMLESPAADRPLTVMPWTRHASFSFRLVEGSDKTVEDLATSVSQPATFLSAVPLGRSGVASGPPLPVRAEGGRLVLDMPVDFKLGRGEGWLSAVPLGFRITPQGPLLDGRRLVSVRVPPPAVPERAAGDPMSLTGFAVRFPWWLAAAAVLIGIAAAAGAVIGVGLWQAPRLRVRSEDQRRGNVVELAVYDRRRGLTAGKVLPVSGVYRQTYKNVIQLDDQNRPIMMERLSYRRLQSVGDRPVAEVVYRLHGKKQSHRQIIRANPEGDPVRALGDNNWHIALRTKSVRQRAA
nr:vWA domain-containing protein [uncultured Rhodopila sp.]